MTALHLAKSFRSGLDWLCEGIGRSVSDVTAEMVFLANTALKLSKQAFYLKNFSTLFRRYQQNVSEFTPNIKMLLKVQTHDKTFQLMAPSIP